MKVNEPKQQKSRNWRKITINTIVYLAIFVAIIGAFDFALYYPEKLYHEIELEDDSRLSHIIRPIQNMPYRFGMSIFSLYWNQINKVGTHLDYEGIEFALLVTEDEDWLEVPGDSLIDADAPIRHRRQLALFRNETGGPVMFIYTNNNRDRTEYCQIIIGDDDKFLITVGHEDIHCAAVLMDQVVRFTTARLQFLGVYDIHNPGHSDNIEGVPVL